MNWFIENKPDIVERNIACLKYRGKDDRLLLALVNKDRLVQILNRMLDEVCEHARPLLDNMNR